MRRSVPAGLVQQIVEDLKEDGTVDRGWLGVTIQDVDEDLAQGLGMDASDPHGALVTNILDDGPAATSEVRVGDAITEVNGARVEGSRDLARKIAEIKPGVQTDLTVMRDGEERTIQLELGQFPSSDRMAALQPSDEPSEMKLKDLGITLAPVDERYDDERRYGEDRNGSGDGPRGEQGVRIAEVEGGSIADDKGLRSGDIIDEVGGKAVYTPRDVRRSLESGTGASGVVVMRIRRDDQRRFVALPLDAQR